ncbi:MAG: hypothetical protein P8Y64_10940 [Gammaproteobacteria bacterium]
MLRKLYPLLLIVLSLGLVACSPPHTPQDQAHWFFEKGKGQIVKSLEKQDVPSGQIEKVKGILSLNQDAVEKELTEAIRQQRGLFRAIIAGENEAALKSADARANAAQLAALSTIGKMHEQIEQVVGPAAWEASGKYRTKRFDRYDD